ncbi:MAG TPA: TolC family protein [candidate division Zixibacteria bacterium]|nr:TolC family protein [candidate division Zixibacteria bacterium]
MFRKILLFLLFAGTAAAAQQPGSAAPPGESSVNAQPLTLDDVVREVQLRNPALTSAQRAVEARKLAVGVAGALPDPTVTLAYMGSAWPFKTMENDPSSYRGVSAMQMLPLGGKRELRREMARKEVNASEADQLAVARRLTAEAKAAYYDYFYYDKALSITAANKARLQQLADISEARYRVGKAMQADVLRANLELTMLLQREVTLQQQREIAAAKLNTLMGRQPDVPLSPPAAIGREALPALAALTPVAEANDPMLKKEQSMIARNQMAIAMAQKEYTPDLSVGYMYQQRTGNPDMYGMQFTVNVPVFYRSKQRQAMEQAKLDLASSEQSREARKLELAYELKQSHATAVNAEKMLDLYDKAILPQAELALQSAQSSYSVGTSDFLTVITNFTTIHGYQLDYYRQLADYQTALARIEALTGDLNQVSKETK